MGKAIDRARKLNPEHAALMDDMKDELLIFFLQQLGGKLEVPLAALDNTKGVGLAFRVDPVTRTIYFNLEAPRPPGALDVPESPTISTRRKP